MIIVLVNSDSEYKLSTKFINFQIDSLSDLTYKIGLHQIDVYQYVRSMRYIGIGQCAVISSQSSTK